MNYSVGQKVRVKEFSELKKAHPLTEEGYLQFGELFFTRTMKMYCGEVYKIRTIYDGGILELDTQDGNNYWFTEDMIEPIDVPIDDSTQTTQTRKRTRKQ